MRTHQTEEILRNANLTVFSYRNNGWNESP
jgi:hypothetical protein